MSVTTSRESSALAQIVAMDLGVDPAYRQYDKQSTPRESLELPGAVLKWYDLPAPDQPVPAAITALARRYLTAAQLDKRGFGAVILHRCGRDFVCW